MIFIIKILPIVVTLYVKYITIGHVINLKNIFYITCSRHYAGKAFINVKINFNTIFNNKMSTKICLTIMYDD